MGKSLRCNDQIRVTPIRLIDENDDQIGIVELDDAKRRAREAELDLVEVAPNSKPPVCRIMDYGKWKYHQRKKESKAKSHAKKSDLKGVRLRPKIDDHDLSIKVARAREFLVDGDKVQFTMLFRGREMAHRNLAMKSMDGIRDMLADVSKVESVPRMMGRRMTMLLVPDRRQHKPGQKEGGTPESSQGSEPPPAAASAAKPPPAEAVPEPVRSAASE